MLQQVPTKASKFDHKAFLCFVDFNNRFDRVRKEDVIKILEENSIEQQITKIISGINIEINTRIIINKCTDEI